MRGSAALLLLLLTACEPPPPVVVVAPGYITVRPVSGTMDAVYTEPVHFGEGPGDEGETLYASAEVLLDLRDLDCRTATLEPRDQNLRPFVRVELTPAGRESMLEWTERHAGSRVGFFVNGKLVFAPEITKAFDGPFQIHGSFLEDEAREWVETIRAGGRLPGTAQTAADAGAFFEGLAPPGLTYLAVNAQGYPEYRHDETEIVLVLIPGGTFQMTHWDSKDGRPFRVEVQVTVTPFFLARNEITQKQWQTVMGENPSQVKGDRLPVADVSWNDCNEFCSKTGLTLPTSAQWEYVCVQGGAVAQGVGQNREPVRPVGERVPNSFGIHDIKGNVVEWCADNHWTSDFWREAQNSTDPVYTNSDSPHRVVRSGILQYSWQDCGSAGYEPTIRGPTVGFRPARRLLP